jgi:signal transduction histidine kinase
VVRDLHDGTQQRLVHTILTLKLAREAIDGGQDCAPELVNEALEHAQRAKGELRELAHGILPAVLTRGGLRAAVETLASRTPVHVEIDVAVDRLAAPVEATAYFIFAEALTNVAKHARAKRATVRAHVDGDTLRLEVRDDGIGGAHTDGSGLVGLADRLAALDGEFSVDSPVDRGTRIAAAIPLGG